MAETFDYDFFLSHSTKDKGVVRPVAERLRGDGLRVWFDEWEIKARAKKATREKKIEAGLERSRVLVLCMSAHAFGSDWAQLETGTFRFRDPLNKERRFIPLRLDEAPIRGSLARFLIDQLAPEGPRTGVREAPRSLPASGEAKGGRSGSRAPAREKAIQLDYKNAEIYACAFSPDGERALTGGSYKTMRLSDVGAQPSYTRSEATLFGSAPWHSV